MPTKLDVALRMARGAGGGSVGSSRASTVGAVTGGLSGSLGMMYGTAQSDSADGYVSVLLDTSDDAVSCACDSPIYEGQRVAVLTTSDGQLKAIPIGDNILNEANEGSASNVVMEYAAGSDGSTPPQSGWSESYPTTADYVWQRTKTTYKDGTVAYGEPACIARPPEGYESDATFYATSSSSSATAAKVATVQSGGSFSLKVGATVSVTFSNANTASSPTLNVDGTGAKPIRTNGTPYAYWAAGASVLFAFDGTYWQVASTPVYAKTVTVGNPASKNVFIDGSHVAIRNGTTEYATFLADDIHLGLNAVTDSNVYLFNDCMVMSATDTNSGSWDGTDASLYIKPVAGKTPKELSLVMDDASYVSIQPESGPATNPSTIVSSAGHAVVQATSSGGIVELRALDGKVRFSTDIIDLGNVNSVRKPAITIGAEVGAVSKRMTSSNSVFTGASTINVVNGTSLAGLDHYGTRVDRSGNYVTVTVQAGAITFFEASAIATVQNVSSSNLAVGIFCSRYSGSGTATPEESFGSLTTWGNGGFCTPTVTPQVFTLRNSSSSSTATFRFSLQGRVTNATGTLFGWMLTVKMI